MKKAMLREYLRRQELESMPKEVKEEPKPKAKKTTRKKRSK